MALVECDTTDSLRVLEIGHYYGLSTCGLVHALRRRGGPWSMVTVDAHRPDRCVPNPAGIENFTENMELHFRDRRLHAVYGPSQMFSAPIRYDFVFYDGDHGPEQARFTEEVIKSPEVKTFVFDDADFRGSAPRCCETPVGRIAPRLLAGSRATSRMLAL
jgi:predicted O-methyltransferase YrrM